jgi:hypothetical protein
MYLRKNAGATHIFAPSILVLNKTLRKYTNKTRLFADFFRPSTLITRCTLLKYAVAVIKTNETMKNFLSYSLYFAFISKQAK